MTFSCLFLQGFLFLFLFLPDEPLRSYSFKKWSIAGLGESLFPCFLRAMYRVSPSCSFLTGNAQQFIT